MLLVTQSGDKLSLSEMTTGSASTAIMNPIAALDFDTWYSLRVEYYTGGADSVRIKVYINGDLICVSDNYFGKLPGNKPTPYSAGCKSFSLYAMGSVAMTVELDNMSYRTENSTYKPETADDTKIVYNIDAE